MINLTIGIITCGRPHAAKNCIDSIQQFIETPFQLVVVDSLIDGTARKYYATIENLHLIGFEKPKGPAEGRKIILEYTTTDYLLLLDDDLALRADTFSKMFNHLKQYKEASIVCGCWYEKGGYRILGQNLVEENKTIIKKFISRKKTIKEGVPFKQVDIGQASMLIKTEIFRGVSFDAQFDFYYDLFDFFMQCKGSGIITHALPNALFDHFPGKYKRSQTLRQTSNKDDDKKKFEKKWGVKVVGPTGAKLEFDSLLNQLKYKLNLLLKQ